MVVIPIFLFKGIDFNHSEIKKVNKEIEAFNKAYKPKLSFKEACDKLVKMEEKDCLKKCERKGIEDKKYIAVYQSTICSEQSADIKYERSVKKLIPNYKCECDFADMVLN